MVQIKTNKRKHLDYLCHHGIEGQKWGVKHGPPYPLDDSVSTGNKLKKRSDKEIRKSIKEKKKTGEAFDEEERIYRNTSRAAILGTVFGGAPAGLITAAIARKVMNDKYKAELDKKKESGDGSKVNVHVSKGTPSEVKKQAKVLSSYMKEKGYSDWVLKEFSDGRKINPLELKYDHSNVWAKKSGVKGDVFFNGGTSSVKKDPKKLHSWSGNYITTKTLVIEVDADGIPNASKSVYYETYYDASDGDVMGDKQLKF